MTPVQLKVLCASRKRAAPRTLARILELAGYEVQAVSQKRTAQTVRAPSGTLGLIIQDRLGAEEFRSFLAGENGRSRHLTLLTAELSDAARADRRPLSKNGRAPSMTLRALRAKLGKTQGEVARKTAMSQPQLSRVEARHDHLISTLKKYVQALGGEIEVSAIVKGVRITLRQV